MAFARSGEFRSGEARSGDFDESFAIQIAGTDRTKKVDFDSLEIIEQVGAPYTLQLSVHGFTPTKLQTVKIYNGGIDVGVPLFVGTIVDIQQRGARSVERPVFHLQADDPVWLLDRYALVTATYRNLGINSIVARLLASFVDPNSGFTKGYVPQSLGTIDEIIFERETVSTCLHRLAAHTTGAIVHVDYRKRVSIFVTDADEGNTLTVNSTVTDFWDFTLDTDPSQLATRVIWEGGGSVTTTTASPGATTIAVEECGWYRYGTTARAGASQAIAYTGVSANSGPGTLTGVSGILEDIPEGDTVHVYAQVDDSTAQTDLATILGGSQSGIAVRFRSDGRIGYPECLKRATSELAFYKNALSTVGYATSNAYTRAGRNVSVAVTTPTALTATLRIQECRIRGREKVDSGTLTRLELERHVTASPVYRTLVDALVDAGVQ